MTPDAAVGWAEHLTNPFALAGFALLVFAGIALVFKNTPSSRLKSAEMHSLLRLFIIGGFLLGALAIVLAFTQPSFGPKTQSVSNIKGSDVAVGGNQAAVIEPGQTVKMQRDANDCADANQTVDGVENSRVTLAGCEASTTARE